MAGSTRWEDGSSLHDTDTCEDERCAGGAVPENMVTTVGAEILNLITTGMYGDPLVIYREYIQNAADSAAAATAPEKGHVRIAFSSTERRVTICDHGRGLTPDEAERALIPVARSHKRGTGSRGFRGIGRLVGLAFGDAVRFRTRAAAGIAAAQIVWDGAKLRAAIASGGSFSEVVESCVEVTEVSTEQYPATFFEVSILGVPRYAASLVMNREAVRRYVGEVCPVPFHPDFPFMSEVADLFASQEGPLVMDIRIDGEDTPIRRPCRADTGGDGSGSPFVEFEEIEMSSFAAEGPAGIGWIAHTAYNGAIPKGYGVRGVRARVGNIQIGGENIFDHLFSEDRFNRWCVGEIHILDPHIVPNARRDYFESGPHLRNFENQLGAICRRLERRCRLASRDRNLERRYRSLVEHAENTFQLAGTGYLTAAVARRMVDRQLSEIGLWREGTAVDGGGEHDAALGLLEEKLRGFRARRGRRSFAGVDPSAVGAFREVFGLVAETSPTPKAATETIEAILKRAADVART